MVQDSEGSSENDNMNSAVSTESMDMAEEVIFLLLF